MVLFPMSLKGAAAYAVSDRLVLTVSFAKRWRFLVEDSEESIAAIQARFFPGDGSLYVALGGGYRHSRARPGGLAASGGVDEQPGVRLGGRGADIAACVGAGFEFRASPLVFRVEPLAIDARLFAVGGVSPLTSENPADEASFRSMTAIRFVPSVDFGVEF
jgi:hypothetical protein